MFKSRLSLKNLSKPTRRYLVIGVSVYLFELLIIFVAQWFGASNLLAVGLSFWLGMLVSFGLQKLVTFQDRRLHHRVLIPQLIAFSVLVLANFGFTLLLAHLLSGILPPALSRTLALGITTIWNFYLYKTRIFKTDTPTVY
jgi:putative flippase GtrA